MKPNHYIEALIAKVVAASACPPWRAPHTCANVLRGSDDTNIPKHLFIAKIVAASACFSHISTTFAFVFVLTKGWHTVISSQLCL